jgi:NAD(P)-dependent dehydrogenase (short-subunit alcohol dehydrogenase family)
MTTTLITGANRGIGLALAAAAAEAGHTVLATARNPDAVGELAGTGARVLALDVSDPASCDALAEHLAGEPIDILINNAATFPNRTGLEGVDPEAFEETLRVNVRGPLLVTRALLPNLRAGDRKTVATVSSSMGSIAGTEKGGSYAYRMSKAAVNMMAKALAAEFAEMTFLAVDPGWGADGHGRVGRGAEPRGIGGGDAGRDRWGDGGAVRGVSAARRGGAGLVRRPESGFRDLSAAW